MLIVISILLIVLIVFAFLNAWATMTVNDTLSTFMNNILALLTEAKK